MRVGTRYIHRNMCPVPCSGALDVAGCGYHATGRHRESSIRRWDTVPRARFSSSRRQAREFIATVSQGGSKLVAQNRQLLIPRLSQRNRAAWRSQQDCVAAICRSCVSPRRPPFSKACPLASPPPQPPLSFHPSLRSSPATLASVSLQPNQHTIADANVIVPSDTLPSLDFFASDFEISFFYHPYFTNPTFSSQLPEETSWSLVL